MIDFRYHLVSVIAIFFALAAGIVLGAGPLSETIDDNLADQTQALRDDNRQLQENVETANEESAYQEVFLEEVTPRLVSDQLAGHRVALVAMPGAEDEMIGAVREGLERAGAEAELTVRVQPTWTDPDSEPVLDQLATDLVSGGIELGEGDGFDRGGAVLAAALLAQPAQSGIPEDGASTVDTTVVTAYEEAELIQLEQDASTAPTLAVVVTGPVSGDDVEQRYDRLTTLIGELRTRSAGVVVAGSPNIEEGGLVGAIRGSDVGSEVSTVDVADQPSGRVAVVFALTEQQRGDVGHYGLAEGVDSALPPVPDADGRNDGDRGDDGGGGDGTDRDGDQSGNDGSGDE